MATTRPPSAACLGELVQHVVVPDMGTVQAGLAFVRDRDAGRVGFLVADDVMPLEAAGAARALACDRCSTWCA